MRDHVLSASGKYQEVLVRNFPASSNRFLFASASYVVTPPPPAKFVLHIPRSSIVGKWLPLQLVSANNRLKATTCLLDSVGDFVHSHCTLEYFVNSPD